MAEAAAVETSDTNASNDTEALDEILTQGIALYRELRDKKERLSEIKDMLRQHAEAIRNGEKTVELTTEDGSQTVDVTFPSPRLKVKADNDEMTAIEEDLGELLFATFFKRKVSFSTQSDFESNLGKIKDPIQKQEIESAVEKKSSTPRVNFPK